MEHNFDLHIPGTSERNRSQKIKRRGIRRSLALLLSVALVAGTCLPAMAAEQVVQAEEASGSASTELEQAAVEEVVAESTDDESAETVEEESAETTVEEGAEEVSEENIEESGSEDASAETAEETATEEAEEETLKSKAPRLTEKSLNIHQM